MKKNTWLSLILLLFSVHNVFATNCKNDVKLIFDEGEAKCLSEFPRFFKFYKLESEKINLQFFKSKQTISFAGATYKDCGSTWGASWGYSSPKGNDREAISWCKKYQTTNCTCSIIFSADAPLGAVKVKIPRDEFIGIFQGVQVEQALNAIEDAKQNKLEKELKKPAEEPKAPEKAQQELKLAQELKEIEDTKAKAQQELKEIEEAKAKAQQELKIAQDAQAREDAISEAKAKAQQELKLAQEAEARAAALEKLKQEEYEKEKQNAAAKARVLEEIKAEAYAKERAILEAKAKAQADLKAEEIAKQKAEEQAKAQAVIDEKNRVAAAKAAEAQAKKNREQEIAEEKRKIAESQKKIEELKNKPLDIENSKLNKASPNSKSNAEGIIASNAKVEEKRYSKSGKAQDEATCGMVPIEARNIMDKCIYTPVVDAGEEFSAKVILTILEEHKKLLSNFKFEDETYSEKLECEKINSGKERTCSLQSQKTSQENQELLKNICITQAKDLMSFITSNKIDTNVFGNLEDFSSRDRLKHTNKLTCNINTVYNDKNKFCEMTKKLRDEQILLSDKDLKILNIEINQGITGHSKENHHVYIESINLIAKKSTGAKYTKELARWGTRTATDIVNKKEYCINFIDEAVAKYYGK